MATTIPDIRTQFANQPNTDFSDPANRRAMEEAIEKVRGQFGRTWPLVIGGERITKGDSEPSTSPHDPDLVVGSTIQATEKDADRALQAAADAFETWKYVPYEERAEYLFRAAEVMIERRFELNAWLCFEVSKSWVEADVEVSELIDFATYYAHQMLRIGGRHPNVPFPGETNELEYIPLGVCAVIPPWNFAGAIMGGMTMAAIVAGNTVVLKPASTSPIIAAVFSDILINDCGLPAGVLNFLPGPGGKIGDYIVDDPRTRLIAFTGSKEIGMRIFERAAKVHKGQKWLKRTVLEMGGKDGLIVDETADLDEAADAIVRSAFGFQGQKCSACSRAIVVDEVYDEVLEKAVALTKKLTVGDPTDGETYMGAVIDAKSHKKIAGYIDIGRKEGRVVVGGRSDVGPGFHIEPTIVADVPEDGRIAQEEIFGPVLAFIRAKDFEHALDIINNTEFGLTGGLMSGSKERLERAKREIHVGNLYLNRKITGALVGVQPFGGFNMSGTDSKAGGPDYLLLFTQAKSITNRLKGSATAGPDGE